MSVENTVAENPVVAGLWLASTGGYGVVTNGLAAPYHDARNAAELLSVVQTPEKGDDRARAHDAWVADGVGEFVVSCALAKTEYAAQPLPAKSARWTRWGRRRPDVTLVVQQAPVGFSVQHFGEFAGPEAAAATEPAVLLGYSALTRARALRDVSLDSNGRPGTAFDAAIILPCSVATSVERELRRTGRDMIRTFFVTVAEKAVAGLTDNAGFCVPDYDHWPGVVPSVQFFSVSGGIRTNTVRIQFPPNRPSSGRHAAPPMSTSE